MKPIYTTLQNYNETSKSTRYAILKCPDLSETKQDVYEEGHLDRSYDDDARSEEDHSNIMKESDDDDNEIRYLEADLEGSTMQPEVSTKASGTLFGTWSPDGLRLIVKVRRLVGPVRVSLHFIEDGTIGTEIATLYHYRHPSPSKELNGTLLSRWIPLDHIKFMRHFREELDRDNVGVVITTLSHPKGELSGFLYETIPV